MKTNNNYANFIENLYAYGLDIPQAIGKLMVYASMGLETESLVGYQDMVELYREVWLGL